MSLTMAGGNINLQLNEVLGVYTLINTVRDHTIGCPSGWKIAILMAYTSYYSLSYPIPMFNIGNESVEYSAICLKDDTNASISIGNISNASCIIRHYTNSSGSSYSLTDTVVFFA